MKSNEIHILWSDYLHKKNPGTIVKQWFQDFSFHLSPPLAHISSLPFPFLPFSYLFLTFLRKDSRSIRQWHSSKTFVAPQHSPLLIPFF
jgi:hypothetical protein